MPQMDIASARAGTVGSANESFETVSAASPRRNKFDIPMKIDPALATPKPQPADRQVRPTVTVF